MFTVGYMLILADSMIHIHVPSDLTSKQRQIEQLQLATFSMI
jgi:hypothetical protein